jgi:putative nucleotidyltransferase with HDIG domain
VVPSTAESTSSDLKRILFVDDEEFLLDGLRDALRPQRKRWAMTFVPSAAEALAVLDQQPQNVVVSDLRMPVMDGAALLARVREVDPAAVRIVLSGQADLEMLARAAGVAHRLLAKPCEVGDLVEMVERSCALQELIARVEFKRRGGGSSALPSVPRLYGRLNELMASGDASAADATAIVEEDIALAAKVLQLANSAFFGRRQPVSKLRDAVAYLGLDALRALALSAAVFQEFTLDPPIPEFDLEALQLHSTRVARLAQAIASETGSGGDVFAAGLLHDVGLLVLASEDSEALSSILACAAREHRPVHEVERELHICGHAEIGAHLLALWGLPQAVTEAVARHHEPPRSGEPFDAAAIVSVANLLIQEIESQSSPDVAPAPELGDEYLEHARVGPALARWRELAAAQCGGGAR